MEGQGRLGDPLSLSEKVPLHMDDILIRLFVSSPLIAIPDNEVALQKLKS